MSTEHQDQTQRPPPQLPHGSPTTLNGLSETFSFHSSPETFIASRVLAFQAEHGNLTDPVPAVHAKILNRNVAVISSYSQISHILSEAESEHDAEGSGHPAFIATEAYKQFMASFYPSPNLLLSDGAAHARMRTPWERRMEDLGSRTHDFVKDATLRHFDQLVDSKIDLYDSLKSLLWKILLGLFLKLEESDSEFREIEKLQEDLLRGQFSLFPVSVSVRIWQSPRSRGIAAKEKLQRLILERLKAVPNACPFHDIRNDSKTAEEVGQIANHVLLFTSSLAVKGISSLLTACLLNLFLLDRGGVRLVDEVMALQGEERTSLLHSVQLETERLSPPIVGIMRRVTRDTVIPSLSQESPDTIIPKGWDAWLYFVGAGRDPQAFGETGRHFAPERFLRSGNTNSAEGLAFSFGAKRCLGQRLVRQICLTVAETMLVSGLKLQGQVMASGVRAWLGWDDHAEVGPHNWARDMKQLPTQRPATPVKVRVVR